jgi:hypothetical protein
MVPPKTKYVQLLNVYFFRQYKIIVGKIEDALLKIPEQICLLVAS